MTDDETWVDAEHANTLNAFDTGDTRTTHAIVERKTAAFKAGQGADAGSIGYEEEMAPTLTAAPSGSNQVPTIHAQTFPIDDGRPVEKHQNGTGIGEAGAPAYTLDRQQQPAVAQTFSVYPEGGNGADIAAAEVDRSPSLTQVKSERGIHVTHPVAATLTSGSHPNSNAPGRRNEDDVNLVGQHMSVRRLTPVECERLMGWPDGWTAPEGIKAPDSKRYAACGDGIVAPVAYWIGQRIQMIEGESVGVVGQAA